MFEINGEYWYVRFVDPDHPIFLMGNGEYTIGTCDDYTKTIYLANNLEGSLLRKVLSHEIVHSAMFSYNVYLSYEQEEILADIIATYGREIITNANEMFKRLQLCRQCYEL